MDAPEDPVNGIIAAPPILPPSNDSLTVSPETYSPAGSQGTKVEECEDQELKYNRLGPSNVSLTIESALWSRQACQRFPMTIPMPLLELASEKAPSSTMFSNVGVWRVTDARWITMRHQQSCLWMRLSG